MAGFDVVSAWHGMMSAFLAASTVLAVMLAATSLMVVFDTVSIVRRESGRRAMMDGNWKMMWKGDCDER